MGETGTGIAWSMRNTTDLLHNGSIVAAVGPGFTGEATRVGPLLDEFGVVHVSPSATGADFSNKTRYPGFFRTVVADSVHVSNTYLLMESFRWRRNIAIIYTQDTWSRDFAERLRARIEGGAEKGSVSVLRAVPSLE